MLISVPLIVVVHILHQVIHTWVYSISTPVIRGVQLEGCTVCHKFVKSVEVQFVFDDFVDDEIELGIVDRVEVSEDPGD